LFYEFGSEKLNLDPIFLNRAMYALVDLAEKVEEQNWIDSITHNYKRRVIQKQTCRKDFGLQILHFFTKV